MWAESVAKVLERRCSKGSRMCRAVIVMGLAPVCGVGFSLV